MTSPQSPQGARVAIVGATGAVGRELFQTLSRRQFPVSTLRAMASTRSAGSTLSTPLGDVTVEDLDAASFADIDIAFFSAGGAVSLKHAPRAAEQGAWVIDNTSAFRMHPETPLVVPEINPLPANARATQKPCIIANPNCSTAQMVLALGPLHAAAGLTRVTVATFQSASGAGQKGIDELFAQTQAALSHQPLPPHKVHARSLAFNCIPQIGTFDADGYTGEEWKMTLETRKILGIPDLPVAATCVRVPVVRSHSEVIHVETSRHLSLHEAREILANAPGLLLVDDPERGLYPTPLDCEGRFETQIGRLRRDLSHPNGLIFWLVSDNLLKGAALNAVQIAEHLWR